LAPTRFRQSSKPCSGRRACVSATHRTREVIGAAVGLVLAISGCGARQTTSPLEAGGHHVLFIGNSLTYTNDLPGTVAQLAAVAGDTIRVRAVALPDLALIDHVNGASDAVNVIRGERWNFVVLQQGPSALPTSRDTLVLATQRLDPFIKASGATSAQFMTWPDATRPTAFDSVLASSQTAAKAVGGVVFPAGKGWTQAWLSDRTLALYGPDGYHPSELGTFLAALVIYEGITGHDARNLPARAYASGRELNLPTATIRLLQGAAHEAVVSYR
jgi:hypothetical protein